MTNTHFIEPQFMVGAWWWNLAGLKIWWMCWRNMKFWDFVDWV